jgi:hypothetical protein
MNSLKSIIPLLSDLLRLSEHALYERQRALVRGGLLKATEGRGPGSGVKATPESVAMLIISVLATDSLSDVIVNTRAVAKATRQGSENADALAALRTFKAAVVHCLSSDDDEVDIKVFRQDLTAAIGLRDGRSVHFGKSPPFGSFVFITAHLPREILPSIRRLLKRTDPPSPSERNPFRRRIGDIRS